MPLFDYPTADEILDDSRLTPAQVNRTYTTETLKADIAQKIAQAGPVVERRILAATSPEPWPFSDATLAAILPKYSEDARLARQEGQKEVAAVAVGKMALHFLYDGSGQLNATYQGKADEYQADAELILTGKEDGTGTGGLLGELGALAGLVADEEQPTDPNAGVTRVSSSVAQVLTWVLNV